MTIHLYTHDGQPVAEKEIPPFKEYPEILVWGDRVFTKMTVGKNRAYREVLAYTIPEPGPADPPERCEYSMMDVCRLVRKLHDTGQIDDLKYQKLIDAWVTALKVAIP
jgi:hypothetical protein